MANATASFTPASYTTSGSISGTNYKNAIGKGSDTAAVSGNDYASSSGSTAYIEYKFDFSAIPSAAQVLSLTCTVKGHLENTSRSTAKLQLYYGSTAKGSASSFTTTSAQILTLTPGSWTRAELSNLRLRFTIGYYGGLVNGATITVAYRTGPDSYFKNGNTWTKAKTVWKKTNGLWVKHTSDDSVIDNAIVPYMEFPFCNNSLTENQLILSDHKKIVKGN